MRPVVREMLWICLLALLPAVCLALVHPDGPKWQRPSLAQGHVTLEMVQSWSEDVLWIDARLQEAYDAGHVPGALLLNEDQWEDLIGPVLLAWSESMRLVVYCDDLCDASDEVAGRLGREYGIDHVYVLEGGWQTWQQNQKP